MAQALIRSFDNRNQPILPGGAGVTPHIYFNCVTLAAGETFELRVPGYETMLVMQAGKADITVDGKTFESVGQRADIWSGMADAVYAGSGAAITLKASPQGAELTIAGGTCETNYAPFRVTPDEVDIVNVGSPETHSHRRICHVLGQNGRGVPASCWSANSTAMPVVGQAIRRISTTLMATVNPTTRRFTTTASARRTGSVGSTGSRTAAIPLST